VILLVDDNCELCEALAELLSRQGYAVQCAANGSEALGLHADSQTRPALILLDLEMPVLDGWGFQGCPFLFGFRVPS
jgi:CheY-like chemotaxis protein